MPACVNWDDAAQTIIRQQLIGKWTYEEYFSSGAETQRLTSSVPHTVHVIVDFSGSIAYDTKILAAAQSFDRDFPANQGCLVLIQCPPYIQAVFDIATRLYPRIGENARYVESLEEAYRVIREQIGADVPENTES